MVNNIGGALLDGVFPHHCVLCKLRSDRAVPLCWACEQAMSLNTACCARCAVPLTTGPSVNTLCGQCLVQPPPYHRVIAPWRYDELMAHMIHCWKYGRQLHLTALLAQLWRQHASIPCGIDLLVPVPLHWLRRWSRGFNQSDLLARTLHTTCPELRHARLTSWLARRMRWTASQSGMSARQRTRNTHRAFTVSGPCDNLRVAIVDDVLTTGATASALAEALAEAGAEHIEVWCLARTPAHAT
ncbi:MAG: ComF family protein [Halioglobus sp.]|nr:ComF family protein [Halioglobus sp.]